MTNIDSPPLLLEPDQLEPLLADDNLLILDCCSPENYQRHHIPGAIHIPPQSLQCGIKPAAGKLPDIGRLTELFSGVGLTDNKHIIAYDDEGGGWAGRLIWTLDIIGHHYYSYLNGGLHAWMNEGHPVESDINTAEPTELSITIDNGPIAEIEDILPNLGQEQFAIWDARSAAEYSGEKVLAQRGGHIPGAINIDWLELIDRANNMRLVNLDEVQHYLNRVGLSKDKSIVTHCQTHHRSSLSYLVMKLLGYRTIKGYHGSWSEWGNREDTPVATDTQ